jgi:gluconolactonase
MNKLIVIFALISFFSKADKSQIIASKASVKQAGTGFLFTEGPAVDTDGRVFFTDQPNDKIFIWDEKKGISLFLENTGRANGLYFDQNGRLIACADLKNQLVAYADGEIEVVFENYKNKHLNGPNDLWIAPGGGIYFTDPYYHRKYWDEGHSEVQDARGVYYLSPDREIKRVIDDFVQPNGIIGTPDGKILYIADINDRKTWRYDILPDGSLANKTFFAAEGSDGMTIDNKGNVYLTYRKIRVYSPDGDLIEEIEIPESPSNVCFGGKKRNILFITARTSVYTLKMKVRGVQSIPAVAF